MVSHVFFKICHDFLIITYAVSRLILKRHQNAFTWELHSCQVPYRGDLHPASWKTATDALAPTHYHSSSCFSKWPNWPKSVYSGPRTEPCQYQAFIPGWHSSDRAVLFYLGPGGAEVARVNRTFDPNRPAPGNWPKKISYFSPLTHALNGVWPALWSCELDKCKNREFAPRVTSGPEEEART